ncbi:MAG: relaxase/mobilization nuclease domain-containing protein, partial [Hyphomicrobiales bacterium]
AMIVGHTDTDNPHVHVVVNLVCPTTGKTASLSNDQLKLSNWAEQYRRDRGEEHFCPQRKKNNDRRKEGEFVKADNMSRPEYEAWKSSQTKEIWDDFRADRAKAKQSRKGQYDALWQQKEDRVAQRVEEIKATFKPKWRDLYKKQRNELKNFDAGFFDRLGFAFSRRDRSKIVGFLEAITNDGQLRDDFIRDQEREKKQLGQEHKSRIADASREARKAWQFDRDKLQEMHKREDDKAHQQAKVKSSEVWKTDTANTSKPDFDETSTDSRNRDDMNKKPRSQKKGFWDGTREKRTRNRPRRRPR